MSTREFWDESPNLMWAYRSSYIDKIKIEAQKSNYNAWLQGFYIYDAVATCIHNGFAKEGTQLRKYMSEPVDITKTKEQIEKERMLEREQQIREQLKKGREILAKQKGEIKER